MPTYEFQCQACKYEWEDILKISDPNPSKCPKCNKRKIKKLISICSGKVELYGQDLTAHLKNEGRKLKQEARKNENLAANIVGEDKYHNNLLSNKKRSDTLKS